jgi:energy-coupling factor transport system substrate-specific component
VLHALRAEAGTLRSAGDIERTILALHACGVSARSLRAPGGLVAGLLRSRAPDRSFGHLSNQTAFAILALRAAGYPASHPVIAGAVAWLVRQQNADGGFGFGPRGGGSDVDDTAAALQALAAAGRTGPSRAKGVAFLIQGQDLDGGYPQARGGESNAQSTAWAIQALLASGRDVRTVSREGSRDPLEYLVSLVAPDGSVRYSRTGAQTPVWVTAQALTALAGKPFPIAPVPRRAHVAIGTGAADLPGRILRFAVRALGALLRNA